ncbi:Hypothetical_protein [Hexamita inflata]|uniref:Hypothetical_protein n=1 Tax=Hexamita inflata TaxID=28002 RepID=A0AA86UML8_9EUKA|nr:Hypothetical protein HINF_LOCUS48944 [Hexamita inflata]
MQGARLKLRDQLLKNQWDILRSAVLRLPVFVKPQAVKTLRRDKKRSTLISFQKRPLLKRWITNNQQFCRRIRTYSIPNYFQKTGYQSIWEIKSGANRKQHSE